MDICTKVPRHSQPLNTGFRSAAQALHCLYGDAQHLLNLGCNLQCGGHGKLLSNVAEHASSDKVIGDGVAIVPFNMSAGKVELAQHFRVSCLLVKLSLVLSRSWQVGR